MLVLLALWAALGSPRASARAGVGVAGRRAALLLLAAIDACACPARHARWHAARAGHLADRRRNGR
jgi:hypothetical protein